MQHTTLIIWDEAPVNHRHCFEALDRTLRDIMLSTNNEAAAKQFGGITVVLGGDFRQTLPIIPKAKKPQILDALITRSKLWSKCKVLQLTENMRLRSPKLSESRRIELDKFARWLLSVGDGRVLGSEPTDLPNISWILKRPQFPRRETHRVKV
jgi:ATP-dependent DNA helicase PIF1